MSFPLKLIELTGKRMSKNEGAVTDVIRVSMQGDLLVTPVPGDLVLLTVVFVVPSFVRVVRAFLISLFARISLFVLLFIRWSRVLFVSAAFPFACHLVNVVTATNDRENRQVEQKVPHFLFRL